MCFNKKPLSLLCLHESEQEDKFGELVLSSSSRSGDGTPPAGLGTDLKTVGVVRLALSPLGSSLAWGIYCFEYKDSPPHIYLCALPRHVWGQHTICCSWLSPSTTWVLGIANLGCQIWWQVTLPAEPSFWSWCQFVLNSEEVMGKSPNTGAREGSVVRRATILIPHSPYNSSSRIFDNCTYMHTDSTKNIFKNLSKYQ